MFEKFDKKTLGIIHPILHKEKLIKQEIYLKENFILKGKNKQGFERVIEMRNIPQYLIRPFVYVKEFDNEKNAVKKPFKVPYRPDTENKTMS